MKQSRYTEEQIIGILQEQEAGPPVAELRRKHGMGDATFYRWKSKYGGIEVGEAKRLRTLEAENAQQESGYFRTRCPALRRSGLRRSCLSRIIAST
jgi:putative transposase